MDISMSIFRQFVKLYMSSAFFFVCLQRFYPLVYNYRAMNTKRTVLVLLAITVVTIVLISCAPRRRWYSTYVDRNGDTQTEHYNQYKRRWYKRNFNNRNIWK
jgi:hypothetical protein